MLSPEGPWLRRGGSFLEAGLPAPGAASRWRAPPPRLEGLGKGGTEEDEGGRGAAARRCSSGKTKAADLPEPVGMTTQGWPLFVARYLYNSSMTRC